MGFRANFVMPEPPKIKRLPKEGNLTYAGGRYPRNMIVSQFPLKYWDNILKELNDQIEYDSSYPCTYYGYLLWECGAPVMVYFTKEGVTYGSWFGVGQPDKSDTSWGGHSYCNGCSDGRDYG